MVTRFYVGPRSLVVWLLFIGLIIGRDAQADFITLTYDTLPVGTVVTTQYQSWGITFNQPGQNGGTVRTDPDDFPPSSPNKVELQTGTQEFVTPHLNGDFADPHHSYIEAKVGNANGFASFAVLTAYDSNGKSIGFSRVDIPSNASGGGFGDLATWRTVTFQSSQANIASFKLTCKAAPSPNVVFVDDLKFDVVGTSLPPDFALKTDKNIALLPGGPAKSVPITVERYHGSTGKIQMSVTGLPAGVSVQSISPNPFTGGDKMTFTVTLVATSNAAPASQNALITGVPEISAGTDKRTVNLPVSVGSFTITSLSPLEGWTPIAFKPGTRVTLEGSNLGEPGVFLQFGNDLARAPILTATSLPSFTNDLWRVEVEVPRMATTGKISSVYGNTVRASSSATFVVKSYRNQHGFAFENYSRAGYNIDTVEELFGYNATHIAIPVCFLFWCADLPTFIPNPIAHIFLGIASSSLKDGQCFGMCLTSQRLLYGEKAYTDFPWQSGAPYASVWNLEGITAPSLGLNNYIHLQHLAQMSTEAFRHWLVKSVDHLFGSSQRIRSEVEEALRSGNFPILSVRDGDGHAVIAYDMVDDPNVFGAFDIFIYDPNVPFLTSENSNSADHALREGHLDSSGNPQGSYIRVTRDGWVFPNLNWTGGLDTLIVFPHGVIPPRPTMPGSLDSIPTLIFGEDSPTLDNAHVSQIQDTTGRYLLNPNGSTNYDLATRLVPDVVPYAAFHDPGPLYQPYILGKPGTYYQTIAQTGTGAYFSAMLDSGFVAQVVDVPVTKNVNDQLGWFPQSGLSFRTGATSKPLTAELAAQLPDGTQHLVEASGTGFGGGMTALKFDAARSAVLLEHHGGNTTFTFRLSSVGPQAAPGSFFSKAISIGDGDQLVLTPTDWNALEDAPVKGVLTHANGQTVNLNLLNQAEPLGEFAITLGQAAITGSVDRNLSIDTDVISLVPDATLSLTWRVRKDGASIALHTEDLPSAGLPQGVSSHLYRFTPPENGTYDYDGVAALLWQDDRGMTRSLIQAQTTTFTIKDSRLPVTVSGHVMLQGISPQAAAQSLTFTFRPTSGGSAIVRTAPVLPDGAFRISQLPSGKYTLHIKGAKWLAKNLTVNAAFGDPTPVTALLLAGDANDTNTCDIFDLGTLANDFNSGPNDANWNGGRSDFNCDGSVDIYDLAQLAENFNQAGDP